MMTGRFEPRREGELEADLRAAQVESELLRYRVLDMVRNLIRSGHHHAASRLCEHHLLEHEPGSLSDCPDCLMEVTG